MAIFLLIIIGAHQTGRNITLQTDHTHHHVFNKTKFNSINLPIMENNSINSLIDDCLLEVFSYLPITDILNTQKVCRHWATLCEESWKKMKHLSRYNSKWYLGQKFRLKGEHEVKSLNDLKVVLQHCGPFIENVFLDREEHPMNHGPFKAAMSLISQHCNNLREIEINEIFFTISLKNNWIDNNWEEFLSKFLHQYRELESFSLHGTTAMSGEFLKYLPTDLKRIKISFSKHIKTCCVIDALKRFNCLRYFNGYQATDSVAKIISDIKTITHLELINSFKLTSSFNYLTNLIDLVSLDLRRNKTLTDNNLINITNKCKKLRKLDISYCSELTDRGVSSIGNLPNLEELVMFNLETTDEPVANFPKTLKQLLCYNSTKMNDYGVIKLIKKAPQLEILHINECSSITNETIEAAIDVTQNRMNNLCLFITTSGTQVNMFELEKKLNSNIVQMTPLLTILHS